MNHLSGEQLQTLRHKLLQHQREIEQHIQRNQQHQLIDSQRDAIGELSLIDNHPGDVASEIYEREKDTALKEHLELHLEDISSALNRIENGDYGICISCHKEIPYERLEAHPTASYCISHAANRFPSFRRPAEEAFLQPPFGRTTVDERDEQSFFDGEDAWQIVESWGTSNTPAMAEQSDIRNYNDLYIEYDEAEGYVQPIESFLATDLYGRSISVIRNHEYKKMMKLDQNELNKIERQKKLDIGIPIKF